MTTFSIRGVFIADRHGQALLLYINALVELYRNY